MSRTIHVPDRGKRRQTPFRTRHEGYGRRQLVWTCIRCLRQHTTKPVMCRDCENAAFHFFQSQVEANRYPALLLQQEQGLIRDLEVHPRFPIYSTDQRGKPVLLCTYVADFGYVRVRDEVQVIEDAKPSLDPRSHDEIFKQKAKFVKLVYGIEVSIYTNAR